jgi:hypothetical protein
MKQYLILFILVFISVQGMAMTNSSGNDVIGGEVKVLPNWDAKVYPNPNNGIFNVMVNGSSAALDLLVFNVIGEKVFELQILGDHGAKINLSGLHKGMYVVQIVDKNRGETVTRRMHVE